MPAAGPAAARSFCGGGSAGNGCSGIGTCTDTELIIPGSYNGLPVKRIGDHAFGDSVSLSDIYFDGTEAQWNAIEKGEDWDIGTGDYTLHFLAGADANGDGVVNGKDVLLLRKYMANYDYDTGTSTVVLGPQ